MSSRCWLVACIHGATFQVSPEDMQCLCPQVGLDPSSPGADGQETLDAGLCSEMWASSLVYFSVVGEQIFMYDFGLFLSVVEFTYARIHQILGIPDKRIFHDLVFMFLLSRVCPSASSCVARTARLSEPSNVRWAADW